MLEAKTRISLSGVAIPKQYTVNPLPLPFVLASFIFPITTFSQLQYLERTRNLEYIFLPCKKSGGSNLIAYTVNSR